MPVPMRIQNSRIWRVWLREREILVRNAAVPTSRRVPWMRSLAMIRDTPLGMSSDAAVWARTSASSREAQSLASALKANYSRIDSRALCWEGGITKVTHRIPGEAVVRRTKHWFLVAPPWPWWLADRAEV